MKIAVLSKSDSRGGGASRVAEHLASGLTDDGDQATHFLLVNGNGGTGAAPMCGSGGVNRAVKIAHGVSRRIGFAESIPFELPFVMRTLSRFDPDVVHIHDTTTTMSPYTVGRISRRWPTVWTFHDLSPFTGGCIYPMGCTRYLRACGACPQTGTWPLNGMLDTTRMSHALKRRAFSHGSVLTTAPSEWMADQAAESPLLDRRPLVIPNPIRTDEFTPPVDRTALRRRLGVPDGRIVIAVSAGSVCDPRKGIRDALTIVRSLAELDPFLIVIGATDGDASLPVSGLDLKATGFVPTTSEMAEWYGVADAYLYSGILDNQPLSILESMSCGVATFGYAVGGTGELCDDAVTGRLRPHGDVLAVADDLRAAFLGGLTSGMGRRARERVLASHSLRGVCERLRAVYRSTVDGLAAA